MTTVSKLRISNILPSIKCCNCEEYVELSKMGEHICSGVKGENQNNIKGTYSSSFPDNSKTFLNETMNETFQLPSAHNKSISSDELNYSDNVIRNRGYLQQKLQIFDRLNTVTPGPLGLHNRIDTDVKSSEYNHSDKNSSTQPEILNKNSKMRNHKIQPYRWPNGTPNQSSMHMFGTSSIKENNTEHLFQRNDQNDLESRFEKMFLSPTFENIENVSTLKDKSNLGEYMNNKDTQLFEKPEKTKNDISFHHFSQTLKKETKFPDENSERYLLEWAQRDKELSSKFIEKAPNPIITIQEHNTKNTYLKMINDKKTSNSHKHGYFFERNSNSTTFSTSSNVSRDEKISTCSMSSPNSDLSISNTFLGEHHKISSKNHLDFKSFDKILNSLENPLCTFYTSDDMLASQTKNTSQNWTRNKHLSDFHCRRCNKYIEGKSIRCSDGKISGRFHRESCGDGIEGKCFQTETDEKYHLYCFTCYSCKKPLNEEYFDIDGKACCEVDAVKLLSLNAFPYQRLEKRKTKILMMGKF
ncbi:hypothetical protein PCANB_000050 [Pneumocystis canis]|nr:hypothetical protein PCANB_000050 [Pneumocystis canis]